MSAFTNRLSDHEASVLVAHVLEKAGGTLTCQVCGTNEWHLSDLTARLDVIAQPERGYPLVVLMCKNCGHVLLFNALGLGAP